MNRDSVDYRTVKDWDYTYANYYLKTGDLQKIDVGIALCHFAMGLEEMGAEHEISISDPGIAVPDGVEYIATVRKL